MQVDPVLTPTLFYQDPLAALDWLHNAFGFEVAMFISEETGKLAHAEMSYRGAVIGVAGEWEGPQLGTAKMRSPRTLEGASTQFIWVGVPKDIETHCARARAAGARIVQEPEDQFYGARTYRALDLEGHVWCFRQTVKVMSEEDIEKAAPKLVFKKITETHDG